MHIVYVQIKLTVTEPPEKSRNAQRVRVEQLGVEDSKIKAEAALCMMLPFHRHVHRHGFKLDGIILLWVSVKISVNLCPE
jgi:hypothetical protein